MVHLAGLEVSVKDMNVCIADELARIVREVKIQTSAGAESLAAPHFRIVTKRIVGLCSASLIASASAASSFCF